MGVEKDKLSFFQSGTPQTRYAHSRSQRIAQGKISSRRAA
jgi:hypothetical protein